MNKHSNHHVTNPYKRQCRQLKIVIGDESTFGVEKIIRICLCALQFCTIGLLIKYITGIIWKFKGRKIGTDVYMIFNFMFPLLIIAFRWHSNLFVCIIIGVLLFESLVYLLTLIFLDDITSSKTASYKRNFIGIAFNYMQTVFTFAVFYLHNQLALLKNSRLGSIYFSLSTQTTLGYGDIHPNIGDTSNITCVILQTIVGLMFIVLFFAKTLSSFNNRTFMNSDVKKRPEQKIDSSKCN